ncbi:MAG: NADH:flavin oxidoreductase/NADH oxidase family protein [Pseudomonadota bacterium]
MTSDASPLFRPLELPCGAILNNRVAKAAMSDSLGDGEGNPTQAQMRLYERWAKGGIGLSIIGEVQGGSEHAEKPGNLVLNDGSDTAALKELTRRGTAGQAHLWAQLGHAGAMTDTSIGSRKGPTALDLPGLKCDALSAAEIAALPDTFARTARTAREWGFTGVEVHAAHGFLLSQFLSPLFNRRSDAYGGSITNRMRLLMEVVEAVRGAVGPSFPVGVKLNATDQLEGGLAPADSLETVAALDGADIDLLDISGGTYFPGAQSASDAGGSGAYFLGFALAARERTRVPLMVTGGFKTRAAALAALSEGAADVVGVARALVLDPNLPNHWRNGSGIDPVFPHFSDPPEGGITAWYTMRLTELGEERECGHVSLPEAVERYNARDAERAVRWRTRFSEGS